jgi:PAS domain S-box-containing protein
MTPIIRRLILLLLVIGIFSPVTPQKELQETLNTYAAYRDQFTKAGNFKEALEYSKKYDELSDRFFNAGTGSHTARLMAEHDARKRESEIQLLIKSTETRRKTLIFLALLIISSLAAAAFLYNRFSAKKKANRLLELEEAKYRALFEQAGDAILLVGKNGYVDCNRKAVEMFGADPEDIIGRTFDDFSPPTQPDNRDSREAGIELGGQVRKGKSLRFPWRFLKKDGSVIDTMVTLAAVPIDGRDLVQTIVHDITESKRLEDERIKAAKLETTTLLAGGLAHDFNNLLGVILGNIELAKMELSPEDEAFTYLSRMETSTRSAVELAHAFNTISEKEFQTRERVPIAAALREAAEAVLKESPSHVRHRLDIPTNLPAVECDIGQIKRSFGNILRNGLEAMKSGGLLEVTACELELESDEGHLKAGRYISLAVTDNGEGITEENLSRIFDPYFSTRGDVHRRGLGTGLTVARSIIQRHHGNVTVSSTAGKGTTVHIYLPV